MTKKVAARSEEQTADDVRELSRDDDSSFVAPRACERMSTAGPPRAMNKTPNEQTAVTLAARIIKNRITEIDYQPLPLDRDPMMVLWQNQGVEHIGVERLQATKLLILCDRHQLHLGRVPMDQSRLPVLNRMPTSHHPIRTN